MNLQYTATDEDNNTKLKYILKNKLYISNILLTKLKQFNKIFVNDTPEFVSYNVKKGDIIKVIIPDQTSKFSDKFKLVEKELDILYEDDYILAVNKPANTPVHPSCDNYTNTLSNYVAYYLEKKGINGIHIVTRLDKNTSGVCIFAKNAYIQELFMRKKEEINLKKQYLCVANRYF